MDVYLNTRRELLIVKKGCSIPPVAAAGSWRKKRKRVVKSAKKLSRLFKLTATTCGSALAVERACKTTRPQSRS